MDDDEEAYEAALIDEFDAVALPPAPEPARYAPSSPAYPSFAAQPPPLAYPSLRAPLPAATAAAPPTFSSQDLLYAAPAPHPPLASARACGSGPPLYPSFAFAPTTADSSSMGAAAPPPLPHAVEQLRPCHKQQTPVISNFLAVPRPPEPHAAQPQLMVSQPPTRAHPQQSPEPPAPPPPAAPAAPEGPQEAPRADPTLQPLSQRDLDAKQHEIERELAGYQHQLDYLAQALAGATPHQVAERKKREDERRAREQLRLLATETRVQHQIERAHEREERRAKVVARAHRASRSPSPDDRAARRERDGEPHEEEEDKW